VVIGRSGSAFAAEIGTKKVTEEVDALKTMAFDPVAFLVAPKFLAMLFMMPALAIWADLMGVVGGCVFGVTAANFTVVSYFQATRDAILARDVYTGIIKSLIFGMVITAVGCQEGFSTGAGAEEVGRSTTSAVVTSIALVILVDLVFTSLFYVLNPS
jgi:phospholipid/cholesterol/gamma-HCH transport system permease protein